MQQLFVPSPESENARRREPHVEPREPTRGEIKFEFNFQVAEFEQRLTRVSLDEKLHLFSSPRCGAAAAWGARSKSLDRGAHRITSACLALAAP